MNTCIPGTFHTRNNLQGTDLPPQSVALVCIPQQKVYTVPRSLLIVTPLCSRQGLLEGGKGAFVPL